MVCPIGFHIVSKGGVDPLNKCSRDYLWEDLEDLTIGSLLGRELRGALSCINCFFFFLKKVYAIGIFLR